MTLVAAAMATAAFNRARMLERARMGWITVTELADTLTRDYDLPFKTSHAVARVSLPKQGSVTACR